MILGLDLEVTLLPGDCASNIREEMSHQPQLLIDVWGVRYGGLIPENIVEDNLYHPEVKKWFLAS